VRVAIESQMPQQALHAVAGPGKLGDVVAKVALRRISASIAHLPSRQPLKNVGNRTAAAIAALVVDGLVAGAVQLEEGDRRP
jgi:hypothetical protein